VRHRTRNIFVGILSGALTVPSIGLAPRVAHADISSLSLPPITFPIQRPNPGTNIRFFNEAEDELEIDAVEADGTVTTAEGKTRWAQGIFLSQKGIQQDIPANIWPLDNTKPVSFMETYGARQWRHTVTASTTAPMAIHSITVPVVLIEDSVEPAAESSDKPYINRYWYSPAIGWTLKFALFQKTNSGISPVNWTTVDMIVGGGDKPAPQSALQRSGKYRFPDCTPAPMSDSGLGFPRKYNTPHMPKKADDRHVAGSVMLLLDINADGSVADSGVLGEIPQHFGFADAARDAVRSFKFDPPLSGGKPTKTVCNLSLMNFAFGN